MTYNYKGAARYRRPLLIDPDNLDLMFSGIRRMRRMVRRPTATVIGKGKHYYYGIRDGWREQVINFTVLLMNTLKGYGYHPYCYSPSNYITTDTQVSVDMDGHLVTVWYARGNHYYADIEPTGYSYGELPQSLVSDMVVL